MLLPINLSPKRRTCSNHIRGFDYIFFYRHGENLLANIKLFFRSMTSDLPEKEIGPSIHGTL